MGKPIVYIDKRTIGRRVELSFDVEFTVETNDDLTNEIIWDVAADPSGKYTNTRIAVEKAKGNWDSSGSGWLEYDGLPRGTVLAITPNSHDVDYNYSNTISGAKTDPTPESPANLVLTTFGMVVGDHIHCELVCRESGTRESWA